MQSDANILIQISHVERKTIRQDTKIKINYFNELIEKYNSNEVSKLEYIKILTHTFKLKKKKLLLNNFINYI